MNQPKPCAVLVQISGEPAVGYGPFDPEDKTGIADMRWNPFPRDPVGESPGEPVTVNIDRWFGPAYFFDRIRDVWEDITDDSRINMSPRPNTKDEYAAFVNVWLGIVDHFGMDADYDHHFFDLVRHCGLEILISGYREEPKGSNPSNDRHFHDLVYSREDFQKEFSAFIVKHRLLF